MIQHSAAAQLGSVNSLESDRFLLCVLDCVHTAQTLCKSTWVSLLTSQELSCETRSLPLLHMHCVGVSGVWSWLQCLHVARLKQSLEHICDCEFVQCRHEIVERTQCKVRSSKFFLEMGCWFLKIAFQVLATRNLFYFLQTRAHTDF